MTVRHFILCHGFGFEPSFWKNLLPLLKNEKHTCLNLGYFGEPSLYFDTDPSQISIGIGHSLGFLKLLSLGKKWDRLIGLQSFVNFLGYEPTQHRRREQELDILIQRFRKFPEKTLNIFYQRCGFGDFASRELLNKRLMLHDLELLKRDWSASLLPETLILGSLNDVIVPPELLYDNFATHPHVRIKILKTGQHNLGFVQASEVVEEIMNFVACVDGQKTN